MRKTDLSGPRPLVIRRTTGWARIGLRELYDARDLVLILIMRDIKLRYRQTALGVSWVVIQPLLGAVIFAYVFGRVAHLPAESIPYLSFAMVGLLGWSLFSSGFTKASSSMLQQTALVSKVYFPRLALPVASVFSALIDCVVAAAVLAAAMVAQGVRPPPQIVLAPIFIGALTALSLGVGLFGSAFAVRYRDIQYLLPVLLQFLLYASPVGYGLTAVPSQYRSFALANPLAGLLEALRWSVLGTSRPTTIVFAYAIFASAIVLLGGVIAFRRMERGFADII